MVCPGFTTYPPEPFPIYRHRVSMTLLAGKVVCITGASRGIGRACAIQSAKYGATGLILHYYGDSETESEVNVLKQEIEKEYPHSKVVAVPGDIADSKTSAKVKRTVAY